MAVNNGGSASSPIMAKRYNQGLPFATPVSGGGKTQPSQTVRDAQAYARQKQEDEAQKLAESATPVLDSTKPTMYGVDDADGLLAGADWFKNNQGYIAEAQADNPTPGIEEDKKGLDLRSLLTPSDEILSGGLQLTEEDLAKAEKNRAGIMLASSATGIAGNYAQTGASLLDWTNRAMAQAAAADATMGQDTMNFGKELAAQNGQSDLAKSLQETADNSARMSAEANAKAMDGANWAERILLNVENAAIGMATDMAIGAIPFVGTMAPMMVRTFGSGVQEAREKGLSEDQQVMEGLTAAATEWFTEKLFGGNPVYDNGAGWVNKGINAAMERYLKNDDIRKAVMGALSSLPADLFTEGLEEVLSDLLNPLANAFIEHKPVDLPDFESLVDDFVVGAALGGLGKAGEAIGKRSASQVEAQMQQNASNPVVTETQTTETEQTAPVAEQTAEVPQSRLDADLEVVRNGGEISGKEAGRLLADADAVAALAAAGHPVQGETQSQRRASVKEAVAAMAAEQNAQAAQESTTDLLNRADGVEQNAVQETVPVDEQAQTETVSPAEQAELPAETLLNNTDSVDTINNNVNTQENPLTQNNAVESASEAENGNVQTEEGRTFEDLQNKATSFHDINEEGSARAKENFGREPVPVPKKDFNGNLTSKVASTIVNAGITTNEVAASVQEAIARGEFSYTEYGDEDAKAKAEARLNDVGFDAAYNEYQKDVLAGRGSKDITVMGAYLLNNAISRGDNVTAIDIATLMMKDSKNIAQAQQARNIINKLSPDGKFYAACKSIDNIIKACEQRYGKDRMRNVKVDQGLANAYRDACRNGDAQAQADAWTDLCQNIADQIPANWADKFRNWRYLSMLGNFKTHGRNFTGNIASVPLWLTKGAIGTAVEAAYNVGKAEGDKVHTKSILNLASETDRARLSAAWADYADVVDIIQGNGKYGDNSLSDIDDMRKIFSLKPLEWARRKNGKLLDAGDVIFSKPAYAVALAGYLKANNISASDYANSISGGNSTIANNARAYAIYEAQKATYRDSNQFSDFVTKLGRVRPDASTVSKAASFVVDSTVPFRKTPANILVRTVEYSPAYVVRAVSRLMKAGSESYAKNGTAKQRAEYINEVSDALDNMSAGLTGTALMGLGVLLGSMGILHGSDPNDEDERTMNTVRGIQSYSIDIGGKNIPIESLSPSVIPMFIGADAYRILSSKSDKDVKVQDALASLLNISEPMLEQSMLSSVNQIIESSGYSDNGGASNFANFASNVINSYVGQYLPTLIAQMERGTNSTRQQTYRYSDDNKFLNASGQADLGALLNKVPQLEYNQMDYVDAWGRKTEYDNRAGHFFNEVLNPFSNTADIQTTDVDREIMRLMDKGFSVAPDIASQSIRVPLYERGKDDKLVKVEGDVGHMTPEEFEQYKVTEGQERFKLLDEAFKSDAFKALSDEQREMFINEVYSYAAEMAKMEYAEGRGYEHDHDNWYDNAMGSGAPALYILTKTLMKDSQKVANYESMDSVVAAYKSANSLMQESLANEFDILPKLSDASERGINSETFMDAYNMKLEIGKEGERLGWSKDQQEARLDTYLDKMGLSASQTKYLDGVFKYYNMVPAEAKKFDTMKELGLSNDKSLTVFDAIADTKSSYDTTQQWEKYRTIATMDGLTESERDTAILAYIPTNSKTFKTNYDAFRDAGYSAEQIMTVYGVMRDAVYQGWYDNANGKLDKQSKARLANDMAANAQKFGIDANGARAIVNAFWSSNWSARVGKGDGEDVNAFE